VSNSLIARALPASVFVLAELLWSSGSLMAQSDPRVPAFMILSPPPEGGEDGSRITDLRFEEPGESVPKGARPDTLLYGAATLRFTFPGGKVASEAENGKIYGNFFDTGIGFGVQVNHLWRISPTLDLGPYIEVDYDTFGGLLSTNGIDTVFKPDTMSTLRTLMGAKIRNEWGSDGTWFGECFLGIGAIFYPSVNATTIDPAGDGRGELFSSKTAFALDLGGNLGLVVSSRFDLLICLMLEINGGPGQGKDISFTTSGSRRPGTMINGGLNFGVNVHF
jgi:hypothetical protein